MTRTAFLRISAVALLFSLGGGRPLQAGMIIFGGDLAGALGGSLSTPTTVSAGGMLTFHFDSGDVAGVGHVSGDVVLTNNATGTAGSVTVTNFAFVSEKPANGSPVSFTVTVSQDFSYAGPPTVSGSEALQGLYTFTGLLESGLVTADGAVNSFALPPFVVPGLATGSSFPQSVSINPSPPPDVTVGAGTSVHLDLALGVSLSGSAGGDGPAADLSNASVGYAAVPEPGTLALSCSAVLTGLGYWWCRRKPAGAWGVPSGSPRSSGSRGSSLK